jgi:AbrB family looped-hinge helix DNA binding protein
MAEIVEMDESGRIVIPKNLRKELGFNEKTPLLLTKGRKGEIVLQKIDIQEMARKLEQELAGTDVDAVVEEVRKEVNEKIRERYPDLFP